MDDALSRQKETARQRALRIPLAYHRTRGPLARWKAALSLLVAVAGGLYVAWILVTGAPATKQISHGQLARVHATWESDCKACHLPFVPVRSDAHGARIAGNWLTLGGATDVHNQADAKCNACHVGTIHHPNQRADEVDSCAGCHGDHKGADFDIARMSDEHCTRCHASIAGHRTSAGKAPIVDVATFAVAAAQGSGGHPAFRSLSVEQDPGNIRFSHRLHMTLGQLYPGQKPPVGKRLVQLACDSCHQPESTTGNGSYMRPVNYEQHCRSCHPLQLPGKAEAIVPHGLASRQLESAVLGLLVGEPKSHAAVVSPERPIPGKTPRNNLADNLAPPRELRIAQTLHEVRETTCARCHSWQEQNPPGVKSASISAVWLQHARFNHQRHQGAAKCQDCHASAFEKLPATGVQGKLADDEQVMIPNIDNCVRCHAPRNESTGTGGARFDCAECHRYHPVATQPTIRPLPAAGPLSHLNAHLLDRPPLRLVADASSSSKETHPFVGTQSCSAAGCHGDTKERGLASAYTRFTVDDPHQQAFLVLYSQPSIRMVRRLLSQPDGEVGDAAYLSVLQQRCLGCHATPPRDVSRSNSPDAYLSGVTCESCHGAAENWQYGHFQRGAKPKEMLNLEDLTIRATACAECHIGPTQVLGIKYDVDHDLIAAGHPRLTFEFETQLANLPAHWSQAKDVKSHFEAWRLGELATAKQQEKLYATRSPLELASHRCFDCHHSLKLSDGILARRASEGDTALPHLRVGLVSLPLAQLSAHQRDLLSKPAVLPKDQRMLLVKLLDAAASKEQHVSSGTRWEELVRFSLALAAFSADHPGHREVTDQAIALQEILTKSFHSSTPERKLGKEEPFAGGPYDSPSRFDPADPHLQSTLDALRKGLATP